MTRPARILFAAMLAALVACLGFSPLAAQDEKKPGKKPTAGKNEKKKDGDQDKEMKEKDEAKPDGDKGKTKEPVDEKQKKQFEKIKNEVEKGFKKSAKEVWYVYTTTEKTAERNEPTDAPATEEPPKGGRGAKAAKPAGSGGSWEIIVKSKVFKTKDRDDAIDKVYTFLIEFPPPAPGTKKKKPAADEPPATERSWRFVKMFPVNMDGETRANAEVERLEGQFTKIEQDAERKRQAKKKPGG